MRESSRTAILRPCGADGVAGSRCIPAAIAKELEHTGESVDDVDGAVEGIVFYFSSTARYGQAECLSNLVWRDRAKAVKGCTAQE